jgi:hypothetical protein
MVPIIAIGQRWDITLFGAESWGKGTVRAVGLKEKKLQRILAAQLVEQNAVGTRVKL